MESRFLALSKISRILIVILFLILPAIGLNISCQSQEQKVPTMSPELPTDTEQGTQPTIPVSIEVIIEGFAFQPAEINVPVGSTVTWYNEDSVIHTVTARNGTFDSGNLSGGDTFSYTFDARGTFEYYCTLHPYMEGKVIVE